MRAALLMSRVIFSTGVRMDGSRRSGAGSRVFSRVCDVVMAAPITDAANRNQLFVSTGAAGGAESSVLDPAPHPLGQHLQRRLRRWRGACRVVDLGADDHPVAEQPLVGPLDDAKAPPA